MSKTTVEKDLPNKTLLIERSFKASPQQLWKAYAEKTWFEKWWGPQGWETTTKAFDFRVGGRIHYCMKCMDKNQGDWFGKEAWGIMEISAIDLYKSFSVLDFFCDETGVVDTSLPSQRFSVTFVPDGDHTRLVSRSMVDTVEQLEELIKMGMVEGFSSQLERLELMLSQGLV